MTTLHHEELQEEIREICPGFLESKADECPLGPEHFSLVLIKPNSAAYERRIRDRVMCFPVFVEGKVLFVAVS